MMKRIITQNYYENNNMCINDVAKVAQLRTYTFAHTQTRTKLKWLQ